MSQQLTLDIKLPSDLALTDFNFSAQPELQKALVAYCTDEQEHPVYYLYGSRGLGKTHLLQACCREITQQGGGATYLPLQQSSQFLPQIFHGLENLTLVAIDDIEKIAGQVPWEEALFHLYNRTIQAGHRLLISSIHPPAKLPMILPDLKSRLSASLVFNLRDLSDEEKQYILIDRAHAKGLDLPQQVATFLLTHYSRNLTDLMQALKTLDHASLSEQRRLTIPLVKNVLA